MCEPGTISLIERFHRELGVNQITTFSTSNVLFLLAAQEGHGLALRAAAESVERSWKGQFQMGQDPAGSAITEDGATPRGGTYRLN